MADFPCPNERIAASALLLLSTTPPSISRSILRMYDFELTDEKPIGEASKIRSCRGCLVSIDSKSSASSSEQSDVSTEAISARPTRINAFEPDRHEIKLKVVRKTRSKTLQVSGGWKFASGESYGMTSSESVSAAESSSCLTAATNSSADSSVRSRSYVAVGAKEKLSAARREELRRTTYIGSTHIRRRVEGILNMLSGGCFSEVTIRQVLGDTPDTSKALRILLKLEKVKRSGTGGRQDRYIYTIA